MRRKKFFKTRGEAARYLRSEYQPATVMDPKPEQMSIFKYGKRYFVGTGVEFDFVRFS